MSANSVSAKRKSNPVPEKQIFFLSPRTPAYLSQAKSMHISRSFDRSSPRQFVLPT